MSERALYKLPLVFEPQPEGGYTVTCPILPELVTEGDTVTEALNNVTDAIAALIEAYEDLGRPMPDALQRMAVGLGQLFWIETAVEA
ncbi:MAG: type II toxin-antitoxin system HicB family antitoxin [Anaerolineae bacterium]|nr:type II toxin-antitoxin system HicB family antitoxin [Anaerolineae bacterium]